MMCSKISCARNPSTSPNLFNGIGLLSSYSKPVDVTACLITRSWISEKRSSTLPGIDLYRQIGVIGISNFCIASCHPVSILIASSYFPCSISLPGNVPMTFNPHFDFSLARGFNRIGFVRKTFIG